MSRVCNRAREDRYSNQIALRKRRPRVNLKKKEKGNSDGETALAVDRDLMIFFLKGPELTDKTIGAQYGRIGGYS